MPLAAQDFSTRAVVAGGDLEGACWDGDAVGFALRAVLLERERVGAVRIRHGGAVEIHGYTTVFWWCAGIFAAGAIICAALLRAGPLTGPGDVPARKPSLQAAPDA